MNRDTAKIYGIGKIETMKTQAQKQTAQAAFFENMRAISDLMEAIQEGVNARSFEQKLNGGPNYTNWADVGDLASYKAKLQDLNDQINREGEYS